MSSGYRGSLPPREDHLSTIWTLTVVGIFVLIIVMASLGLPTGFASDPTPTLRPSPSALESPSAESPSASPTPAE